MEIIVSEMLSPIPITIIQPIGEFDISSVDQFNTVSQEALDNGAKDVIIDLSEVPFMSSAGVRSISTLYQMLHPKKSGEAEKDIRKGIRNGTYKAPHLKLLNPSNNVMEVLKMVGLDMYLDIFKNEKEAISSFSN